MTTTPRRTGKDPAYDTLHADLLRGFPALVRQLGGDGAALLEAAGLRMNDRGDVGPPVTYRQLANLLETAATELDCADFGLRLARSQDTETSFGLLGRLMRSARTFGEALESVVARDYAHSLAAKVQLHPLADNQGVFVWHDILVEGVPRKAQAMEQILLLGHLGAREFTAGRARVRRVHFRHQAISSAATYRRYFGCEVRFGQQEDGIEFSARDLAAAVVDPDEATFAEMMDFIDARFTRRRTPLHAQARGVIMHLLGTGLCTNEEVSRELGLHPRTLHRRLRAEGTTFQRVKDEVRCDLMLYYLQQTDIELTLVAEKLDFAEQSIMTRSCRRWLSATPSDIRRGKAVAHPRP